MAKGQTYRVPAIFLKRRDETRRHLEASKVHGLDEHNAGKEKPWAPFY